MWVSPAAVCLALLLAAAATALLAALGRRLGRALADRATSQQALQAALAELKRCDEQIKVVAHHDPLTGLANRLLFADRLAVATAQAARLGTPLAVLFIDLDRFKVVNDSLGHAAGDALLRAVAARLVSGVRTGDTVARLGGDEFVVLLPGADRAAAVRVAEKIGDALRLAFRLDQQEVVVTASIGISLFPEHGATAENLLRHADVAMYHAKLQGRDSHRFFVSAMTAGAAESLALETALRRALERDELSLHYQPIVDLRTGRIRATEALLRWRHPALGLVWPADFIPLAEVTGLIHPISRWALRTACRQAREWRRSMDPELGMAINLSALHFQQAGVAEGVAAALGETGLAAGCLELEITESYAMQSAEQTIGTLRQLKRLGVQIAIDDFGVGYSSLSYLKRFPVDTLKIDESLIREVDSDPQDAAIVTAVIQMAHTLGLRVVAEGVETDDQRRFLVDRGCDRAQGFLLGHPVPAEECGEILREGASQGLPMGRDSVLAWPAG